MRRIFLSIAVVVAPTALVLELASCGHVAQNETDASTSNDAAVVPDQLDEPYFPDASCLVMIQSPPLLPAIHVPIGTDITTWDSNPPSSGEHYPIWAAYQEYSTAVPRGYYVHDLEHGAIDFLYNCPDGGDDDGGDDDAGDGGEGGINTCAAIIAGFEQAVASIPTDPLCDPSVRVRFVITPDPLITTPVAAAAWGWTYNAACLDLPTLEAFANAHYAQGPEDFCTNGITGF